jgi:hypothetical protein
MNNANMKQLRGLAAIAILFISAIFFSCAGASGGETEPVSGDSAVVSVKFATVSSYGTLTRTTESTGSKSSMDEDAVDDVYVMVFNGSGKLVGSKYTTFSTPQSSSFTSDVTVNEGTTCTVYAVANLPESSFSGVTSLAALDSLRQSIGSAEDICNTSDIVMFGKTGEIDVSSITDSNIPSITLRRITGRLDISIVPGSDITITGYQLCHVPTSSYVADSVSSVNRYNPQGTYVNFTDVSGQSYTSSFTKIYYVYENLVGKNANATTQLLRTSSNAPSNATYMTIWAEGNKWKSEYKIYIGGNADDSTDYNIYRNSFYTYYIEINGQGAEDVRVIKTTATFSGSTINGWQTTSSGNTTCS